MNNSITINTHRVAETAEGEPYIITLVAETDNFTWRSFTYTDITIHNFGELLEALQEGDLFLTYDGGDIIDLLPAGEYRVIWNGEEVAGSCYTAYPHPYRRDAYDENVDEQDKAERND